MIREVYNNAVYMFNFTLSNDVLWIVIPLILATLVMLFYFQKYNDERAGWNTHVANSLVLLFVSIILLKHIYNLDGGLISYVNYLDKFIISSFLLFFGLILLFFNFGHLLPEKIASYMSSPLFVNLVAYVIILRVYADVECSLEVALGAFSLFIILGIVLFFVRIPLRKFFEILNRMKEKEEIEDIDNEKKNINKKKRELKKEEKKVIKKKEKEIKSKRKKVSRLNKTLRKPAKKKKKK